MTSTKPYLIRAFNEWILDNELTPYVLIDAEYPNVYAPKEYVQDGRIVFNITPGIVFSLIVDNEFIEFEARFSGHKRRIYAPIGAVLAIYAKENGQGMAFEKEAPDANLQSESGNGNGPLGIAEVDNQKSDDNNKDEKGKPTKRGKPNLRVIK